MQHMAAQKVGFTLQLIRHGSHKWHILSSAAAEEPRVNGTNYGTRTLGACKTRTRYGPQITPSGTIYMQFTYPSLPAQLCDF